MDLDEKIIPVKSDLLSINTGSVSSPTLIYITDKRIILKEYPFSQFVSLRYNDITNIRLEENIYFNKLHIKSIMYDQEIHIKNISHEVSEKIFQYLSEKIKIS